MTFKPGYNHIGYCQTSDSGRRAVWIHYRPHNGHATLLCLGPDHKPMSVSGDPIGLRQGTIGIEMAIDAATGRVRSIDAAKKAGFEPA